MALAAAQRIAKLMPMRASVLEWAATFENHMANDGEEGIKKYPLIVFDSVACRHPDGEGSGWDGEISLDVPLAIIMLRAALAEIDRELVTLGVDLEGA